MLDKPIVWILFNIFILAMLAVDLGVFNRKSHTISIKEALIWSGVWISMALLFALGLHIWMDSDTALKFITGYLIEKSLSVDNLFVFLTIFSYFAVPSNYQHKVLFWGIVGALIMRAILIFAGVALIHRFEWIIYIFGAFLIFTGYKMMRKGEREVHPESNPVIRFVRRMMPVTKDYAKDKFFVKENGRRFATPLIIVLLVIETTDVMFALDSIPAILAITVDPFIVYSSNVFAILGLRALYFALAGVMRMFEYLHYGLAAILIFVGIKMMMVEIYKIPVAVALGVVAGILLVSVLASILKKKRRENDEAERKKARTVEEQP